MREEKSLNITTDNSITSVNGVYESKGVTNTASNGANKVNADDTAAILTLSSNGDSDGVVNVKRTSSVSSASSNMSYTSIVNAQNALRTMGYYNGPNSGYIDNVMRTAIRKFEKDYGMAETGSLTENVYDRILTVDSLLKNKEMQTQLTKLGFYDGDKTHIYKALKNFQKLYGLTEDGKYNSLAKVTLTKVTNEYDKLYNSSIMDELEDNLCHYNIVDGKKVTDKIQKDAFVKVYVFLKHGMGLNINQIAGVMGNLHAESAILADNVNDGAYSGEHNYKSGYEYNSGDYIAFGLLQWANPARKAGLKAMAETMAFGNSEDEKTKALWDINVQLAYFKQEMTTEMQDMKDYSEVWKELKRKYTYNEVSDLFLQKIESPNNWEAKKETRREFSKMIFDSLKKL